MRIVHLVAGAGSMYCGSCLHGNRLAAAQRALGADVLLVPLYTSLRTDEPDQSSERLAFGGINVYLQQQSALFRHTPRFVDRWLDRPALVRRLARLGGGTRPERLAPLLISMLEGRHGRQRKELDKLVEWLAADVQPELIHLSNVMLAGLADELRRRLGTPVVGTLSGEDAFVQKMPEPQRSAARQLLGQRCRDLSALVAMSHAYADQMAAYLDVPRRQIRVIRPGLNLDDFPPPESSRPTASERLYTIGYLGRVCAEKGLHVLVEAVGQLRAPVRLHLAGYLDPADGAYLEQLGRRAAALGLAERFAYLGELDRPGKIGFLRTLDLFCMPSLQAESKALPVVEAWAAGCPVVLPDWAPFRELIDDTGGGLLYEPESPAALAAAIARLMADRELAAQCAHRARQAVHQRYSAQVMAEQTLLLYREVIETRAG
jgi:glycosyltransferase involved in cell wall biosynthesis